MASYDIEEWAQPRQIPNLRDFTVITSGELCELLERKLVICQIMNDLYLTYQLYISSQRYLMKMLVTYVSVPIYQSER